MHADDAHETESGYSYHMHEDTIARYKCCHLEYPEGGIRQYSTVHEQRGYHADMTRAPTYLWGTGACVGLVQDLSLHLLDLRTARPQILEPSH